MPSNLLILPLIAGFLFIRICYYTRYRAQGIEGYRLLFYSAVVGLGLLAVARLLVLLIRALPGGMCLREAWRAVLDTPYGGTAVASVFVGVGLASTVNGPIWGIWRRAFLGRRLRRTVRARIGRYLALHRCSVRSRFCRTVGFWHRGFWYSRLNRRTEVKQKAALNWATTKQNNQLLLFLNQAAQDQWMISVSMVSRKFYIGYVKTAPRLDPADAYFRLYPVRSGYRDDRTLRFEMTTDYDPVQAASKDDPVFVILPIGDVRSANVFDAELYAQYFASKRPAPPQME